MKINTNLPESKEAIKTDILFSDIPIGTTFIHVYASTIKIEETKTSENTVYCIKCAKEHKYSPNTLLTVESFIYK